MKKSARLCEGYLAAVGLGATGRVGGLFHDGGKFTTRFDDYIHERSDDKRGDIDHSFAGAKFLFDEAGNKVDGIALAAATLIAHRHGSCTLGENGQSHGQKAEIVRGKDRPYLAETKYGVTIEGAEHELLMF